MEDWSAVLALFEKSGELEGRWGWLEVLLRGMDGDSIRILSGMPKLGQSPSILFAGKFVKIDGSLYLQPGKLNKFKDGYDYNAGRSIPINLMGHLGGAYLYIGNNPRGWGTGYINACEYNYPNFDASKVDWPGFAIDGTGLIGDALTSGTAGRAINILQVGGKSIDLLKVLDIFGIIRGGSQSLADSDLTTAETVDLGLGITGIFVPFYADAASMMYNFHQGWYLMPIQEVVGSHE